MNNMKHIPYFSWLLGAYIVWFVFTLVNFLASQASFAYLSPVEVVTTIASAIFLPLVFTIAWAVIALDEIWNTARASVKDDELQKFQLVNPVDAYRADVNAHHNEWVDMALAQILWKLNEAQPRKTRAHRRRRHRRARMK